MYRTTLFFVLIIFLFLTGKASFAQTETDPIALFLDELANRKLITLNSAAFPDSRMEIAELLLDAEALRTRLDNRQSADLDAFLREYAAEILVLRTDTNSVRLVNKESVMRLGYDPPGFETRRRAWSLAIRPLLGYEYRVNQNGEASVVRGGGNLFGRIGKHVEYRLGVEQVWQSQPLALHEYLTTEPGYDWKTAGGNAVSATEWSGMVRAAWNWGEVALLNDRPVWGIAEHGTNILSGKAPAFPYFQFKMRPARWFEFRYIHGILQGDIADSSRSDFTPGEENIVFHRRYLAANLFTIYPWKTFAFSFGNSIVYNADHVEPIYFIPFLFFKSVDQTFTDLNSTNGQNNALFFTLSWRGIRYLHLYATAFVDDFKMDAFLDSDLHNEISYKAGAKLDGFPFRNVILAAEYTRTNPMTWLHYVEPIRYTSGGYCLGHYLRENSDELFVQLTVRPLHGLSVAAMFVYARHGEEQTNLLNDNYSLPVLKEIVYRNTTLGIQASYAFFQAVAVFAGYRYSDTRGDVRYSPELLHGRTSTLNAGIRLGL